MRKVLAFAPPAQLFRPDLLHRPAEEPGRDSAAHSAAAREAERRTFESACRLGQRAAARTLESVVSERRTGLYTLPRDRR